MTTKQRLELMEACNLRNRFTIQKFLSNEPITRRKDPRYRVKVALEQMKEDIIKAIPECIAMTVGIISMLFFPAIIMLILGM